MGKIQKAQPTTIKTVTKRMQIEKVMRRYCINEEADAFKPDKRVQSAFIATQLWYSKWRRFKKKVKASEASPCLINEGVWRAFNRRNPGLMANSWLPVVSNLGSQLDAEMAAEAAIKAVEVALASQLR